jgi:hypothetical protein
MGIVERFNKHSWKFHITIGILSMLTIGFIDFVTGIEFRMEIFYLAPIAYVTWFVNQKSGIAASALSLMLILFSDLLDGKSYHHILIETWNLTMYFIFFIIVAVLIHKLRTIITALQKALSAVKELSGILPICANCKKIRDDDGYWQDVAVYISKHTNAEFTHGLCKECTIKLYPELINKVGR